MKTELENIEKMLPAKLFKPKFMGTLLKAIEIEVTAEVPDVETPDGRKAITSLAYKVARSKTTIDDLGKGFVAEQKQAISAVDEVRRMARQFLDQVKINVRQPLTDWEEAEQFRIVKLTDKILVIEGLGAERDEMSVYYSAEALGEALEKLRALKITKAYAEYQDAAINAKNAAVVAVLEAIPLAEAREMEAENARLFAEQQADNQRIEEEQRIAREAVEAADLESTRELEEIQRKAAQETAEQEAREKDVKHRRKCNNEAVASLMKFKIPETEAKLFVKAVATGKIDHITINY